MAYIGIDPNVGDISFQQFTGDGSTTAFTLAQSVASGEAIIVTIGNVVQEPGASAAYTAYANTLTFSAAPANGDVVTVRYFGRAVDQPLSYGMQLFKYVATASQTVFTGADSNGAILAFSGTDVDVYLNGVHLDADDFTPSSGNTITLATGASLNDDLVVRAFRAFSVTDTVSASSGGTFNGAVTFDAGANFGDNDKAVFGAGSDLQIYHDGFNSFISDTGTGALAIVTNGANVNIQKSPYEPMIVAHTDGAVDLYHNNALKFATTATGVNVTGTVTADKLNLSSTTNIGGSAGTMSNAALRIGTTAASSMYFDTNEIHSAETLNFFSNGTDNSVADYIRFSTGGSAGSERMRINSSGNVFINTTTQHAGSKLTVGGTGAYIGVGGSSHQVLIGDDGSQGFLGTLSNSDLQFRTNNTERMRITAGGNVGIGTASPAEKLTVSGNIRMSLGQLEFNDASVNIAIPAANTMSFDTSGVERMRIGSNGTVSIGGNHSTTNKFRVLGDNPTGYTTAQFEILSNAGNVIQSFHAGGSTAVLWKHPRGSQVLEARNNPDTGYININANAFAVQSDYRLKENIVPISNATERLKKLNPVRFNFKPFEETGVEHHGNTVDGFLANEVSHDADGNPIVPEAVTGEKDAMRDEQYVVTPAVEATYDDDGNILTEAVPEVIGTRSVPDYQFLDQSKLVPLLVKTIQELEARIAALEAN